MSAPAGGATDEVGGVDVDPFLEAAIAEAQAGFDEGGIPIGSVLVVDGEIVGRGHNQRVQRNSAVFHAEIDALENAGRLPKAVYRRSVLYTTLAPCHMCAGAVLRSEIPRVVVGENVTMTGAEGHLVAMGVEVDVRRSQRCIDLMARFAAAQPEVWAEDHM